MQSYSIVKTISKRITPADADNIITLFDNSAISNSSRISLNGFVKNLKAFSKISSLGEVNLPVFELEDSESQKLFKTLDVEFNSPRKQLDLFIGDAEDWNQVGSISLLNPSGYPYRMYNLLDFYTDGLAAELGENGRIGVKVADVGYGLLSGADVVTVHGSYVQEYVLSASGSSQSSTAVTSSSVAANTDKVTLLAANSSRVGATIYNNAVTDLLIDFDDAIASPKAVSVSAGGYYELPFGYKGLINGQWKLADPEGEAEVREFS